MKITALKRQKKHLTLVSFEDGEILLDNDICLNFWLRFQSLHQLDFL